MGEWASGRVNESARQRVGDWAIGQLVDWAIERLGDWTTGRPGERATGRLGDLEIRRLGDWGNRGGARGGNWDDWNGMRRTRMHWAGPVWNGMEEDGLGRGLGWTGMDLDG